MIMRYIEVTDEYIKQLEQENKQLKDKLSKIETLIINHNCDTGDIYYKYNSKFLKSELKQRILEIVMNKKGFLKAIMGLPKAETNNPINDMIGINADDFMSAVDRLSKVPDYNDLLKENQELELELSGYRQAILNNKEMLGLKEQIEKVLNDYCRLDAYNRTQQKEFIKYLENESKEVYRDGGLRQNIFRQILQKYKEIIGGSDETN